MAKSKFSQAGCTASANTPHLDYKGMAMLLWAVTNSTLVTANYQVDGNGLVTSPNVKNLDSSMDGTNHPKTHSAIL
jgi:hypothetical protein